MHLSRMVSCLGIKWLERLLFDATFQPETVLAAAARLKHQIATLSDDAEEVQRSNQ